MKRSWLLTKLSLFGVAIALGLGGCEAITDFLPSLPNLDIQRNRPKSSGVKVQSQTVAEMETEVRQQINKIRTANNLNSLENNEQLAQVARKYSQKMARENFFSHTSPDGDTPAQRVRDGGIFYLVVGENLFQSTNISRPVPVAVAGWMDSPGHRANILHSAFTQTGVGVWRNGNKYYITQLFMRSLF